MKYSGRLESHWKIIKNETILHTTHDLKVSRQKVELPDGSIVNDFYQIRLPETATIMAITKANEVLCLEQYKHGPRQVCLTLPGGLLERKEHALKAAKRELLEETGYISTRWLRLGSYILNGNQGVSKSHLFLALDIRKIQKAIPGDLEAMELKCVPLGELYKAICKGEMPIISHVTAALMSYHLLMSEFSCDIDIQHLREI